MLRSPSSYLEECPSRYEYLFNKSNNQRALRLRCNNKNIRKGAVKFLLAAFSLADHELKLDMTSNRVLSDVGGVTYYNS